jgi:hypothetical protein
VLILPFEIVLPLPPHRLQLFLLLGHRSFQLLIILVLPAECLFELYSLCLSIFTFILQLFYFFLALIDKFVLDVLLLL